MRDYNKFYEALTAKLGQSPGALCLLSLLNSTITKLMYLLYPLFLVYIAWDSPRQLLSYLLIPGISFLLVSLVRKLINQERPYEKWNITPLIAKDTVGQSMPSRHVFSATMISMCFLSYNVCLGSVLLLLSVILAVCRVLAGVHYPKDVLVGMLLGLLAGFALLLH